MMYDGNEKVILNGEYLDYSMLDFWRWAYTSITQTAATATMLTAENRHLRTKSAFFISLSPLSRGLS